MKKKKRLSVVPPASALPGIDLFVFGDTHVNSRVGLLAPGCRDDEGAPIKPSASQVWLWERWLDFVSRANAARKAGRRVFVLGLGDLVDENTHDGFQLHEPFNYATMLRMAHATHKPLVDAAERVFLIRGTAAHTGGAGYLEELPITVKPGRQNLRSSGTFTIAKTRSITTRCGRSPTVPGSWRTATTTAAVAATWRGRSAGSSFTWTRGRIAWRRSRTRYPSRSRGTNNAIVTIVTKL